MRIIDLRSDTVTQPTDGMRRAIAEAAVGDDVYGEDPTVKQLEERMCALFEKEAALFVPTGVMGNQLCLKALTQPGDEVIVDSESHIFHYETAAPAVLSGLQLYPLPGERGVWTEQQLRAAIRPRAYYFPPTRVICLEQTHNRYGGAILPLELFQQVRSIADEYGLFVHCDGARIWNAAIATNTPLSVYARYCDTLSVCFSKGLGAPIGSMILGSAETIARAHKWRKVWGGGMRQVGILAAAALYALEHHYHRLAEDHRHARLFAEQLAAIPGITVSPEQVETNIVLFHLTSALQPASAFIAACKASGVLLNAIGPATIRAVFHLHIRQDDLEDAVERIRDIVQEKLRQQQEQRQG